MPERFMPTEEWPLQQIYKERLHDRIQRWGDFVAPVLQTLPEEDRVIKERVFQWLMESVERDDKLTAGLVDTLDIGVRQKYIYGDAFDAIRGESNNPEHNPGFAPTIQSQFMALCNIYEAGIAAAGK